MSSVPVDHCRILHVEDDPALADVVATYLEGAGEVTVLSEHRVTDGLERLDSATVDCVVSDYDMPGETGLDFLRAVREDHDDLPFILYTGKGSEEIASDAISAGVTDYLQKGTGTDQYEVLLNRITNAVESYRAKRQLHRREREFRTLLERSPVPTVLFDREEVVYANPSAVEFTGLEDREEMIGSDAVAYVHPEDRDQSADRVRRVIDEREPVPAREYRIVRADGEIRHARGTLVPATFDGQSVAQAVLVDVTEYKDG